MTTVHRNSISKRSSAISEPHPGQRLPQIQTQTQTQTQRRVGSTSAAGRNDNRNSGNGNANGNNTASNGSMIATMSRIEYLNRKFNMNPSFDIDITDDDINDDGTAANTAAEAEASASAPQEPTTNVTSNQQLLEINVEDQKRAIEIMQDSVDTSLSLLQPLNKYIDDFQSNLKTLSNEMQVLQARLHGLNQDIDKCKRLDGMLTPVLNDLLISPKCIRTLSTGKINENWVLQLTILLEKKEILQQTGSKYNPEDVSQIIELVEKLELKCVSRIKKFMIETIKHLRTSNAASVAVQRRLLKVKDIFKFLQRKDVKLAKELETAYIYTMRWYYYFNFVKYISSLEGLRIWDSDYDTVEERKGASGRSKSANNHGSTSTSASASGSFTSTSLMLDNSNVINEYLINLPRRFEQMEDESGNKYAILAQIAETAGQSGAKFFMEQIFQFLNSSVMDNATIEFTFIVDFFLMHDNEEMCSTLKQIFNPVFKLGTNFTKFLLGQCSGDYFGIKHTIKRVHNMQFEVQHRCLPEILESYLDTQLMLLWPALQKDMDILCTSLNNTMNSTSVIKSVVSSKNNIQVPLQVTQSFGTVLSGLAKLLKGAAEQSPLSQSVNRLSSVYEKGLVHLADTLSSERKNLFLYVNLQQVAIVLDTTVGSSPLSTHYGQLVQAYSP